MKIRQEVGATGGQAGRGWSAAIAEKEVVGNVGSSGGGVGRASLSILLEHELGKMQDKFLSKRVPTCKNCLSSKANIPWPKATM